jgi:hypothetical protein
MTTTTKKTDPLTFLAERVTRLEADAAGGVDVTRDAFMVAHVRAKLAGTRSRAGRELLARLQRFAPRRGALSSTTHAEHRTRARILETEIAILREGLVDGEASAALKQWVGREVAGFDSAMARAAAAWGGDAAASRFVRDMRERIGRFVDLEASVGIVVTRARVTPGDPCRASADSDEAGAREREADAHVWKEDTWRRWEDVLRRATADEFFRQRTFTFPSPRSDETEALARALGVDLTAAPEEIKRRLRQLAFAAHPDRGGDHERMVRVNRLRELVGVAGAPR